MHARRWLSGFILALLGSCSSDPTAFSRCSPLTGVTISAAAAVFSRTPSDCSINSLAVVRDGLVSWLVFAPAENNGLTGPVTYGVTPAGAGASQPEQLVAGTAYTVELTRRNDAGTEGIVARKDFVFSPTR